MKKIRVISVCGSGTVTSSMVANKVKEFLGDNGFRVETVETNPNGVETQLSTGHWDMIVHTSPLKEKYDMPTVNAASFLTGMGEEKFENQLLEAAKLFK